MRLLTWNCNDAFRDAKVDKAFAYSPDIVIIQECGERDARLAAEAKGYTALWFGNSRLNASFASARPTVEHRRGRLTTGLRASRGIGIFVRPPWFADLLHEPDYRWLVPFRVVDTRTQASLTLIAVWSWLERSHTRGYVDLVRSAVEQRGEWFDQHPVILAGDFNSSAQWDAVTNDGHSGLVRFLERRGVVSVFHHTRNRQHGEEDDEPTFFMNRQSHRPFHIDYIFMSKAYAEAVTYFEVGGREWLRYSDHLPLYAEIDDAAMAATAP